MNFINRRVCIEMNKRIFLTKKKKKKVLNFSWSILLFNIIFKVLLLKYH